MTNSRS